MTSSDLELENQRLRAEIEALERRLEERERASREQAERLEAMETKLADQARVLDAMLTNIPDGVIVGDERGHLTHFNAAAEQIIGLGKSDLGPEKWSAEYGIFHRDMVTPVAPEELAMSHALKGEPVDGQEVFIRHEKRPNGVWLQVSSRTLRDEGGAVRGAIVVFHDISERKRWEKELEQQLLREQEKNEMLERLRVSLLELSTPILEVWDDILALPVIGVVDSKRSAELMERLLQAVEEKQCRFVIIDITGVEVVDSATADRLLKLVGAVEILGARCVVTGARGAVAQTLVALGVSLGPLVTLRNLKQGLMHCLRSLEDRARPPLRALYDGRARPDGRRVHE